MSSCKDCKFAFRKGHWCEACRKNTMPYHNACELFDYSEEAKKEKENEYKFPIIVDFEVNSLYVMARAMEKLIYDIDKLMARNKCHFDLNKAKKFARIKAYIDKLKEEYDVLEKDYVSNLHGDDYDLMNRDANELVRLMLLFGDKCSRDQENNDNLFKHLRSMSGENVVKEEDLKRFYNNQW